MKLGFGVAAAVAIAAVGYAVFAWANHRAEVAAYAEALGLCEVDPLQGSARIEALKVVYGDAPKSLALRAAVCRLSGAAERVESLSP